MFFVLTCYLNKVHKSQSFLILTNIKPMLRRNKKRNFDFLELLFLLKMKTLRLWLMIIQIMYDSFKQANSCKELLFQVKISRLKLQERFGWAQFICYHFYDVHHILNNIRLDYFAWYNQDLE